MGPQAYITYIIYIHTYLHTYIDAHIHTYVPTCIHRCTHTYIHTYTHTHTHTHNILIGKNHAKRPVVKQNLDVNTILNRIIVIQFVKL